MIKLNHSVRARLLWMLCARQLHEGIPYPRPPHYLPSDCLQLPPSPSSDVTAAAEETKEEASLARVGGSLIDPRKIMLQDKLAFVFGGSLVPAASLPRFEFQGSKVLLKASMLLRALGGLAPCCTALGSAPGHQTLLRTACPPWPCFLQGLPTCA